MCLVAQLDVNFHRFDFLLVYYERNSQSHNYGIQKMTTKSYFCPFNLIILKKFSGKKGKQKNHNSRNAKQKTFNITSVELLETMHN